MRLAAWLLLSACPAAAGWANATGPAQCVPDNTCCGIDCGACCSGRGHGTLACGTGGCGMCKKIVGKIIGRLAKEGCAEIIPEGDAACEAIGLGPEDPLADICAFIVTTGCPIIAREVAKGVKNPEQICEQLKMCGTNSMRCGCLKDDTCADSSADCCTKRGHHTGACGAQIRCGCLPDGQCIDTTGSAEEDCCSKTEHHTGACASNRRCGTAA